MYRPAEKSVGPSECLTRLTAKLTPEAQQTLDKDLAVAIASMRIPANI
jgi:hypothetical protein